MRDWGGNGFLGETVQNKNYPPHFLTCFLLSADLTSGGKEVEYARIKMSSSISDPLSTSPRTEVVSSSVIPGHPEDSLSHPVGQNGGTINNFQAPSSPTLIPVEILNNDPRQFLQRAKEQGIHAATQEQFNAAMSIGQSPNGEPNPV